MSFAKSLIKLHLAPKTPIALLGYNSPEHFIALMGTFLANCTISEIYLTNGAEACYKQVMHSKAKLLVCDTHARYKERFLAYKQEYLKAGVTRCIMFGELGNMRIGG